LELDLTKTHLITNLFICTFKLTQVDLDLSGSELLLKLMKFCGKPVREDFTIARLATSSYVTILPENREVYEKAVEVWKKINAFKEMVAEENKKDILANWVHCWLRIKYSIEEVDMGVFCSFYDTCKLAQRDLPPGDCLSLARVLNSISNYLESTAVAEEAEIIDLTEEPSKEYENELSEPSSEHEEPSPEFDLNEPL